MKFSNSLAHGVLGLALSGAFGMQLHAQSLPAIGSIAGDDRAMPANDDNGTLPEKMRLETVGYRLATANADTCAKPVMRTGLVLHDLAGYALDQRARISRDYDITYGFGILGVVPGSPGDLAGLRSRDEIIAVNGGDLAAFQQASLGVKATFARTGAFTDFLAMKLAQGPVTLLVRRGTDRLSLSLSGLPGCGGFMSTVKSGTFNAWSDGKGIAVTTHLIHYAVDDSELAFVVAHEMSHNLLGHNANVNDLSQLLAIFGIGSVRARRHEITADQFAIHLLARTAYDKNAAITLLTRLNRNLLMKFALDFSHPTLGYRIALTKAAMAHEDPASTTIIAAPSTTALSTDLADDARQMPSPARFDPPVTLWSAGLKAMMENPPMGAPNRFSSSITVAPLPALDTAVQTKHVTEKLAIPWWMRPTSIDTVNDASGQTDQILSAIRWPGEATDTSWVSNKPSCTLPS
jgi:hypothetical protein